MCCLQAWYLVFQRFNESVNTYDHKTSWRRKKSHPPHALDMKCLTRSEHLTWRAMIPYPLQASNNSFHLKFSYIRFFVYSETWKSLAVEQIMNFQFFNQFCQLYRMNFMQELYKNIWYKDTNYFMFSTIEKHQSSDLKHTLDVKHCEKQWKTRNCYMKTQ